MSAEEVSAFLLEEIKDHGGLSFHLLDIFLRDVHCERQSRESLLDRTCLKAEVFLSRNAFPLDIGVDIELLFQVASTSYAQSSSSWSH